MNSYAATVDQLRQLDISHRTDGDGGYEFVSSIRDYAKSIDNEDREILWDVLFRFVEKQDSTLWGVALEALVQENPPRIASRLNSLIDSTERVDEWKDQIALAVLRLSYKPAARKCLNYVRFALQKQHRAALPVLAALCHVDAEACIALAADYFGRAGKFNDFTERHQGYIPAFVRNLIEVDDRLLRTLVERTTSINSSAGKKLVEMLKIYLEKPFLVKDVGWKKIAALRDSISAL